MSGIWMPLMARGGGQIGSGGVLLIDDSRAFPTSAHCGVTFNSDGSTTVIGNNSTADDWYFPHQAGIGASFWVKFTLVSGTAWTGPASGSIMKLDSSGTVPRLDYFVTSPGTLTAHTARVRFDFYSDAAGTVLVGSWTTNTVCEST